MAETLTLRQDENGKWHCVEEPEATVVLVKQFASGRTIVRRLDEDDWRSVKIVDVSGPKPKII